MSQGFVSRGTDATVGASDGGESSEERARLVGRLQELDALIGATVVDTSSPEKVRQLAEMIRERSRVGHRLAEIDARGL